MLSAYEFDQTPLPAARAWRHGRAALDALRAELTALIATVPVAQGSGQAVAEDVMDALSAQAARDDTPVDLRYLTHREFCVRSMAGYTVSAVLVSRDATTIRVECDGYVPEDEGGASTTVQLWFDTALFVREDVDALRADIAARVAQVGAGMTSVS